MPAPKDPIFYDEETNDCSNLDDFISLCRSCHCATNINREYWKIKLTELVCCWI